MHSRLPRIDLRIEREVERSFAVMCWWASTVGAGGREFLGGGVVVGWFRHHVRFRCRFVRGFGFSTGSSGGISTAVGVLVEMLASASRGSDVGWLAGAASSGGDAASAATTYV